MGNMAVICTFAHCSMGRNQISGSTVMITPILKMRKVIHREVKYLPKVTQLWILPKDSGF